MKDSGTSLITDKASLVALIAGKGDNGGLGQGGGSGPSALFKQRDKNSDGKLGKDELPAALFDKLDADKDGFVTPVFEIADQQRTRDGYHNLSHHGQSKEKLAELEKVDFQQMRHLRDLFDTLAATPTADGSRLLDQTMVLYGSNLGDANVHNCTNLPILLAGGGLKHGQHLAFDTVQNKPLCNLYVTMLQHLGVEAAAFASSNGTIADLAQV